MWELSTPFMHFRWFLFKIGKDHTQLYKVNGVLGIFIFFLCRNIWGPILSYKFWVDSFAALATPQGVSALPMSMIWFFRVCTVMMNCLNAYWFSKMFKILLEAVRESKAGTPPVAAVSVAAKKLK